MTRRRIFFVLALLMMCIALYGAMVLTSQKKFEQVKIVEILDSPVEYEGKYVKIVGNYCGWKIPKDLPGPPITSPPETRSDWIICDDTGWIYATARGAGPSLNPIEDYGAKISVYAQVKIKIMNNVTVPYLYPIKVELTE